MIITPQLELHFQVQRFHIPTGSNFLPPEPVYSRIAQNRECQDVVAIFAPVNAFGHIRGARFKHDGCVISKVSADIACSLMEGETLQSMRNVADDFVRRLENSNTVDFPLVGKWRIIADLLNMMCTRQGCVALPWLAVKELGK
jgi:NifU-like protein involved in Fe-S cluster formation